MQPGQQAVVLGGPGVVEALAARACSRSAKARDAVVVGFHRDFDYERMKVTSDTIRGGAVLIGTNDDATYPTPAWTDPWRGAGSFAAVRDGLRAFRWSPGKPHSGDGRPRPGGRRVRAPLMVGDKPRHDSLFAVRSRLPFGLVLSGIMGRRRAFRNRAAFRDRREAGTRTCTDNEPMGASAGTGSAAGSTVTERPVGFVVAQPARPITPEPETRDVRHPRDIPAAVKDGLQRQPHGPANRASISLNHTRVAKNALSLRSGNQTGSAPMTFPADAPRTTPMTGTVLVGSCSDLASQ